MVVVLGGTTGRAAPGASVPWITYEAENMTNNGTVMGPSYAANVVESESSGRRCVKLDGTGQYVQFAATAAANAMVVRYSVPDSAGGGGADYTLTLYINGSYAGKLTLSSKYSWLYGSYPFNNTPPNTPRNFYDETRTNGFTINPGDVIRLQKDAADNAAYYIIDLVDLENVAAPIAQPSNSLSIMSYGAGGAGVTDDTAALNNCITAAAVQGKSVWLPAGTYKITSAITIPGGMTVRGAGLWHSTLVGDAVLYTNSSRRVTLNGNGNNIQLSDFAILGRLNYRNDAEYNDGIGGRYGTGSAISRIWVEHTKVGAWIINSQGLLVSDCRFRNVIADGINLSVGRRGNVVSKSTARGTGDDCFAIWPATYTTQNYKPGLNVYTHCTAQSPFLANGAAIYGGEANRIEDCLILDTTYGCGILFSTTFDVGTNNFSGTTVARRSDLLRCGGYTPGYNWRAALQLCLDNSNNSNIPGVDLNNLNITDSISDGLSVIGYPGRLGTLPNAIMVNVNIPNYGLGVSGRHGLWARNDARGSMTVSNCTVVEYRDDSADFAFSFVTSTVPVKVQASPAGHSFTVDGTNFTSEQVFNWLYGSTHTLSASSPQSGGAGIQHLWSNWSDGGARTHTITAWSNITHTAAFTTQFYLTMTAGAGGGVNPASGWFNSNAPVNISALPSNGFNFSGWVGSGAGSYSGGVNSNSVVMNGPIGQTAIFSNNTKIISLTGSLAFGSVPVGSSSNRSFVISNSGVTTLTVSNVSLPSGFSASWTGGLTAGTAINIPVSFSPVLATNYGGSLTVNSDATGGVSNLAVSGLGIFQTNSAPVKPQVVDVLLSSNSSLTIVYSAVPGYPYHIDSSTNLNPPSWGAVAGSATNAMSPVVSFTDTNLSGHHRRFYRVVSP